MGYNSKKEMWEKLIQEMRESKKHQKIGAKKRELIFQRLNTGCKNFPPKQNHLKEQGDSKETKWLKVAVKSEAVLIPQSTGKIEVCIGNYRVVAPNFSPYHFFLSSIFSSVTFLLSRTLTVLGWSLPNTFSFITKALLYHSKAFSLSPCLS
jgi:hypothetical protein